MCVHFPQWSLQRNRQQRPELRDGPLAILRPANRGRQVVACCPKARRYGVRAGMLQAEALAIVPALTCVDEDLDADRQTLARLAEWAQRFSPIVGLEDAIAPACLLLDTTGCASCFGGEEALLDKAQAAFEQDGWHVRLALASTIGAAWALAHFRGSLHELPVLALRLSPAVAALLQELGIERIGQLAELPRDQVADRFGIEVGVRLDQAFGRADEVITPIHAQPEATASWTFEEPIERHDILAQAIDLLLERLQSILEGRHVGTRLIECVFELDGAPMQRVECSLSRPAQTARYLKPLLQARLEQIRLQAPIRAVALYAVALEPIANEQPNLFEAGNEAALAQLLDSLASRLGREVVTTPRLVADSQPERACEYASALDADTAAGIEDAEEFAHRPLRLFPQPIGIEVVALGRPQRFRYAGSDHRIVHCQGPERIETGWWRHADIHRDYYRVEVADGTSWWIFQRLSDGRWFLHGCFD